VFVSPHAVVVDAWRCPSVITLSGSVLFASNKSERLPAAQERLTEVAKALNQGDDASQMVVEGHTDAKGSATRNQEGT